jgi:hypothetical protein
MESSLAYRTSLAPNRPIRAKRRRFRTLPLPAWQTLLLSFVTYSVVASWVVHTGTFAMLLRFETPSGEVCLCSYSNRWNRADWYRVLREAAVHPGVKD